MPAEHHEHPVRWIVAVVAAAALAAGWVCWQSNGPMRSGSGRIEALDRLSGQIK
jgi:hypothetical protein